MKRTWIIVGGALLIVVLAGAAFVGGRLLNTQRGKGATGGPMLFSSSGPNGSQKVSVQLEPSQELPATKADIVGLFKQRSDASIFVGTGEVKTTASMAADGSVSMSSENDGPTVEVVVTHDTVIYRDVTMKQFDGPPESGKMRQVVEPGTLDEIGDNSMLQVWGERSGDRIVATVLVYFSPAAFRGTSLAR